MSDVTSCEVWDTLFATHTIQDVLSWYRSSAGPEDSFGKWAATKYATLYSVPVDPEWIEGLDVRYGVATAFGSVPQVEPQAAYAPHPAGVSVHYLIPDVGQTPINSITGLRTDQTFIDHLDVVAELQGELKAVLCKLKDAGVPFVFVATVSAQMTENGSDFGEFILSNYTGLENMAPRQAAVLALYEDTVRSDLQRLASRYIQLAAAQHRLSTVTAQTWDFYRRMAEAAMMFNDVRAVRSHLLPSMVLAYRGKH